MPGKQKLRATCVAFAALCAAAIGVPAASADDAHYEGISADGGVAVFSTTDKLTPGDTDVQRDIYSRRYEEGPANYVTREVSLGPTGGNDSYTPQFLAVAPAGDAVFFSTKERLTADDKDGATDIYVRDLTENKTKLVSAGDQFCLETGCGEGNFDAVPGAGGVVDAGNKVFFVSLERLSVEDTDEGADLYMRNLTTERTKLISRAAPSCAGCGAETKPVVFQGAAGDGSKAIFTTAEKLSGGDKDTETDLYERDLEAGGGEGETKLVTAPGGGAEPCPTGANCRPSTSIISADGSHVFFETGERIAPADTDAKQDVYDWSGGTAALASVGSAGENGEADARYLDSSADGGKVFFATVDQFAAADEDAADDVYARAGGAETALVSEGDASCAPGCGNGSGTAALEWVSDDGSLAVLTTPESLTEADTDTSTDVYSRALPGGPTRLVSVAGPTCGDPECGNGDHNAGFAGASADGSHLFFVSEEALAPPEPEGDPTAFGDGDKETDVYERSAETTSLVSLGQQEESGVYRGNGEFPAQLRGVSDSGAVAFFTTDEQLTEADEDGEEDVYQRSGSITLLVSRANGEKLEGELAPPGPTLAGTNPQSPASSTAPKVYGSEPVEASIKLYATDGCDGEPVATGSAAQLKEPGLAVSVAAGSTTTFHATAEADGFVSPCSGSVTYTQQSGGGSGGGGGGGSAPPATSSGGQPGPGGLVRIPLLVPRTRITFGPAFKTRVRRPVFRFTDTTEQAGTHFRCKLDRRRWHGCGSPVKLRKLSRGKHVFRVRGINANGVAEARPSKRVFKLVGGTPKRKHRRHTRRGQG
jgi:hypothetical protein